MGYPFFWYFTGSDGYIKRKSSNNITKENIMQYFSKMKTITGVVAVFLYPNSTMDGISRQYMNISQLETFLS
jgi:hypothetical protein